MREAGFTLVELMVAVVVIAVLAGIAVVSYNAIVDDARAEGEIARMFTALSLAEEQYYAENGTFISTGADEGVMWPSTPASEGGPNALTPLPATWQALGFDISGGGNAYCSYVVIAGAAGDDANLGAKAAEFGMTTAPPEDWFYILAECDFDGDPTVNSFYFKRSTASVTQKQNEGK